MARTGTDDELQGVGGGMVVTDSEVRVTLSLVTGLPPTW